MSSTASQKSDIVEGRENSLIGDDNAHFQTTFPRRHSLCCTQLSTEKVTEIVALSLSTREKLKPGQRSHLSTPL